MRLALIFSIIAIFALGIETKAQTPASPTEKQVDAIFSAVTQENSPGLAVLVRKEGHTLFEKGYGVRDLRTNVKIDPHTNFLSPEAYEAEPEGPTISTED